MTDTITLDEFEELLGDFGSDITLWPQTRQEAALRFAETTDGRLMLAADAALDDMFAASLATGPEGATDSNSDAFVDRLIDIPVYHHQVAAAEKVSWPTLWLKTVFADSAVWLSPRALASQAATFVAVLGVGFFVGLNSAQAQNEFDEVDISETWFVSDTDYDLDEQ